MKRLFLTIGIAFLAGLIFIRVFDLYLDPEKLFFKETIKLSDAWAASLPFPSEPRYVFAGGSEIRTSIDPALLQKDFGIASINSGLHAGFGIPCNLRVALDYLRKGDTLVLSTLVAGNLPQVSNQGLKFAFNRCGISMFDPVFMPASRKNIKSLSLADTPRMCLTIAKCVYSWHILYKYRDQTVLHPSGWMEVLYRDFEETAIPQEPQMVQLPSSQQCAVYKKFLLQVQQECSRRGAYLLLVNPIRCSSKSERLKIAIYTLLALHEGIPVLKDERLGVVPLPSHFADTNLHPNSEAARQNTQIIGDALKNKSYWTDQELMDYLHTHAVNLSADFLSSEGSFHDK